MSHSSENHNIARSLVEVARSQPQAPALICRGWFGFRRYSFAELDRTADRFASALAGRGVGRTTRVMLMVRPSLEFIALTFALFKLGAVVILIDPGMGYKKMLGCIGTVKPEVFAGIPRAMLFRKIFKHAFRTVTTDILVAPGRGLFDLRGRRLAGEDREFPVAPADQDDLAAILFTTGSTGPPKGVRYEHTIFQAQLELIRSHYRIGPGDVDQPAFPLFALFTAALGGCAVLPEMDPSRPARVNPRKFTDTIRRFGVTYSFGSPAIWNVVSRWCLEHQVSLPSLKKVLMAGAPVPGELIDRVRRVIGADGEVHVPYGATESLPIASISGREVLAETWEKTRRGGGACVGRPLPGIAIRVIRPVAGEIMHWREVEELAVGEVGEIVVQGPVVTRAYDHNERETRRAKIHSGSGLWHRMGDLGSFDDQGRLWFHGRQAHRVFSASGPMDTIACEAVFNEHPMVRRTALVGVPADEHVQTPVLCVELVEKARYCAGLEEQLRDIARAHSHTRSIDIFLPHPGFPVDIRHNAKIFREKLAVWASAKLGEGA